MMQMASGQNVLWKTVTLQEDKLSATDSYWIQYLDISNQTDLDNWLYFVLFTNNTAQSYAADFIVWTNNSSNSRIIVSSRSNYSDVSKSASRSLYATAGTQIDVYRLPKHNA